MLYPRHLRYRVQHLFGPALVIASVLSWVASPGYSQGGPEAVSNDNQVTSGALNTWTSNGPEGGSYVRCFAIDFSNPAIIYAGTARGLFVSTDGGTSWSQVNGIPTISEVAAVAIDPSDPSIIYAGVTVNAGVGLYKSTDRGASWSRVSNLSFYSLAIDPSDPTTIYGGSFREVYKSTDRGVSWRATGLSNLVDPRIFFTTAALAVDPENGTDAHLMTWWC